MRESASVYCLFLRFSSKCRTAMKHWPCSKYKAMFTLNAWNACWFLRRMRSQLLQLECHVWGLVTWQRWASSLDAMKRLSIDLDARTFWDATVCEHGLKDKSTQCKMSLPTDRRTKFWQQLSNPMRSDPKPGDATSHDQVRLRIFTSKDWIN